MKRRGLSGVVTIILIILLVLVAIGIIWSAIRPPIEEVGERISGDCLTLNVEPLSCTDNGNGAYTVNFIRNAGAGTLSDVSVVFYDTTNDQTQVVSWIANGGGLPLPELQTGLVTFNPALSNVDEVNVAAVTQPGDTPITCKIPESRSPVSCGSTN